MISQLEPGQVLRELLNFQSIDFVASDMPTGVFRLREMNEVESEAESPGSNNSQIKPYSPDLWG